MKNTILVVLTTAVALLFGTTTGTASPSTHLLDDLSLQIGTSLSNLVALPPPLTREQTQQKNALNKAVADFNRPSDSLAGDLKILTSVLTHLKILATNDPFASLFQEELNDFGDASGTLLDALAVRVHALSDFSPSKTAASNQLFLAAQALGAAATETNNVPQALASLKTALSKIAQGNAFAQKAETHPGFARDSVVGSMLHHQQPTGKPGDVHFDNATDYTDTDADGVRNGTYTYQRNGLNTAVLVLRHDSGSGTSTITVKLTYTSASRGAFTFRQTQPGEPARSGTGSFTLQ